MKQISLFLFLISTLNAWCLRITNLSDLAGREGSVTELDLSNKGIKVFPQQILLCKNLKVLNLSNNGILSLPEGVAHLKYLKTLDLSGNQGLSHLDLAAVFSAPEFRLENLNLSSCGLLALPENLGEQKEIRVLNISNNRLSNLPYSMMDLSKLVTINLSKNELSELGWVANYWWSLKQIDATDNNNAKFSALISTLSFFDRLEEIRLSRVDYFPKDFELLNVDRLYISNSTIGDFPRSKQSNPIRQLFFDDCVFEKPSQLVTSLNEFSKPDFVQFSNIPADKLLPFLELQVDSVSLIKVGNISLAPLAQNKDLKFLDIRNNPVDKKYVDEFSRLRPDVEVFSEEPIIANVGIDPPFSQFVEEPTQQSIVVGTELKVDLGAMNVTIPAQGIVDKNGNPFAGEVILEYQSYSNPTDIFFSGITMTAQDENGETMMFSSGGMFSLEATDKNGNELFVNPEEPIQITMNSASADPSMGLYQLDENGVWQYVGENQVYEPFKYDQAKIDSVLGINFTDLARSQIQFTSDRYVPMVKWNRDYETFELRFKEFSSSRVRKNIDPTYSYIGVYDPDYVGRFFCKQRLIFEGDSAQQYFEFLDSLSDYCHQQYERLRINKTNIYHRIGPNYFANIELSPDFENDRFNMTFLFKDTVIALPVNLFPREMSADQKISETKSFYKRFVRNWRTSWKVRKKNRARLKSEIVKRANMLKERAIREEKARQELAITNEQYMNTSASDGSILRAFNVNGFGLWNCDVLRRLVSPKNIDRKFITEEASERMNGNDHEIVVIDHDNNSVISFPPSTNAFFDSASKTTIVVFFSSVLIGIHNTWTQKQIEGAYQVKLLNIETMNKAMLSNYLINAQ